MQIPTTFQTVARPYRSPQRERENRRRHDDVERLAAASLSKRDLRFAAPRQHYAPRDFEAKLASEGKLTPTPVRGLCKLTPCARALHGLLFAAHRRELADGRRVAGVVMSARDLAEKLGFSRASIFRAARQLEAADLLERINRYAQEEWTDGEGRAHRCKQRANVWRLKAAPRKRRRRLRRRRKTRVKLRPPYAPHPSGVSEGDAKHPSPPLAPLGEGSEDTFPLAAARSKVAPLRGSISARPSPAESSHQGARAKPREPIAPREPGPELSGPGWLSCCPELDETLPDGHEARQGNQPPRPFQRPQNPGERES